MLLSGGSCVTLHSSGKYVSADLDFVLRQDVASRIVEAALAELGLRRVGRVFTRPGAPAAVDILPPPPAIGGEPVRSHETRRIGRRVLELLTPTDCVKDRLGAFFHWDDRQALAQAVLVARACAVDLREIRRWSLAEDRQERYREFRAALR